MSKKKEVAKKMGKKDSNFDSYYKTGKGDLGYIKKNWKEYQKYSQERHKEGEQFPTGSS